MQADAGDFDVEATPAAASRSGSSRRRPPYETSTTAAGRPLIVTRKPPTTRLRGQRRCRRTSASASLTVCLEFRRPDRLAHQFGVIAVRLEIDQRIVVAGDDDDGHLGMIGPRLHDQVQPVERAQPDVGDKQVERADGEQPLGGVVGRRAGHVMSGVAQEFHDAGQGMLVVIEDEDSIGQFHERAGAARNRIRDTAEVAMTDAEPESAEIR